MSCVMKTKIVPRDDVKVMPSITALHGAKGVLGNQEIGGGCSSASSKRSVMAIASMDTNAEKLTDVSPSLMARNYKGGVWVVYEAE